MKKKFLLYKAYTFVALFIIGLSLALYTIHRETYQPPIWQAHHFDQGDYRFVAEHFWGLEADLRTYDAPFSGDWGAYLHRVPFREIGIGTILIGIRAMLWVVSFGTADLAAAGFIYGWLMKILLCIASFFCFQRARTSFGTLSAFLLLLCVVQPVTQWRMTDDFLTESMVRTLLLVILGLLLDTGTRQEVHIRYALVACIALTLVRVQWQITPVLLAPLIFWILHKKRASIRSYILTAVLIAAAPLSNVPVHEIGWGVAMPTPGVALHVNFKNGGSTMAAFCLENPDAALCDKTKPRVGWWNLYIGTGVSKNEFASFDAFAKHQVLLHPLQAMGELWNGMRIATNYPFANGSPLGQFFVMVADTLSWILLLIGLTLRRTRLLSAFGLSLWLVPAIADLFTRNDMRYFLPMAGIVFAAGLLVLSELITIAKTVLAPPARTPPRRRKAH